MELEHRLSDSWNTPPSVSVPGWIGQCSNKNPRFSFLSADLIRVCKPHGPPCGVVVNRDPFRELRFGQFVERRRPLHSSPEASILRQKLPVFLSHGLFNRFNLLLHRQSFIGCPWVRRRPCLEQPPRPVQVGIFNCNADHPDLSALLAERIPKRPMRGSPRAEFGIGRVARIDVDEGDGFLSEQSSSRAAAEQDLLLFYNNSCQGAIPLDP